VYLADQVKTALACREAHFRLDPVLPWPPLHFLQTDSLGASKRAAVPLAVIIGKRGMDSIALHRWAHRQLK
jgi:hypothetical protein